MFSCSFQTTQQALPENLDALCQNDPDIAGPILLFTSTILPIPHDRKAKDIGKNKLWPPKPNVLQAGLLHSKCVTLVLVVGRV